MSRGISKLLIHFSFKHSLIKAMERFDAGIIVRIAAVRIASLHSLSIEQSLQKAKICQKRSKNSCRV